MNEGYASHKEYIERVKDDADARHTEVELALREAFEKFLEVREVEVINFELIDVIVLSEILLQKPQILKPLLILTNLAGRAMSRDLGLSIDTYNPRIDSKVAAAVAGYIKPFLPPFVELPTLTRLDRIEFIDKEIRKNKGAWEKEIVEALARISGLPFKKCKFSQPKYELDAAYPDKGEIEIGIDIKRIEARADIHKRCDEIVNKAQKLRSIYPNSKFGAVLYYPFITEQGNVRARLQSSNIDGVVFASEGHENIDAAIKLLLPQLGINTK